MLKLDTIQKKTKKKKKSHFAVCGDHSSKLIKLSWSSEKKHEQSCLQCNAVKKKMEKIKSKTFRWKTFQARNYFLQASGFSLPSTGLSCPNHNMQILWQSLPSNFKVTNISSISAPRAPMKTTLQTTTSSHSKFFLKHHTQWRGWVRCSLSLSLSPSLSLSLLVGLVIPQSQRSISSSSRSLRRWYSLYWMRQWR